MKKRISKFVKGKERLGKYDAVSGSSNATGAGNKRRKSVIETTEESGSAGVLNNSQRLKGVNLARDLERNYSVAKSLFKQLRNNIVGALGKIQVNTDDEFGKEATTWFNKDFFNNCDFRSTEDFSKITRNILTAKKREGDILVYFDDGSQLNVKEGGTGKIICYESDMICDLTDKDKLPNGCTQESGVVRDQYGREIGYIVSKKRGQVSIDSSNLARMFRRDPDNEPENMVKLIKSTFRINQGRGTSELLSAIADMLDCYEMRSKELQSAKLAASLAGTIEREESITDYDDVRLDPTNENPADGTTSETTLPEEQTEPVNYERMEALTGGIFDYLAKGDKLTLHDIKRPNIHMAEFIDHVTDAAGSVFGFAHAYSRMRADTSYTAFRGDMVMSWVSIIVEQKDLEREWLDWVGVRAIEWALRNGKIKSKAPDGWQNRISWHLPVMPFVDELKERQANAAALKNGEKTFSDLLGPDWNAKFEAFANELAKARKLGLPLSVFEQKSGGMAEGSEQETEEVDDE
jgi:capsid protein